MTDVTNIERGEAVFSDDREYRYVLSRTWDVRLPRLAFIGLNPSTADEAKLDPTLRRVIGFAQREGCGGLDMLNLFAFRATFPRVMKLQKEPVGPENDTYLTAIAGAASVVIAGWGTHGTHQHRDEAVRALLRPLATLWCLGLTKDGQPKHPLYLPKISPLVVFQERAVAA